jgi:hypothetical protein
MSLDIENKDDYQLKIDESQYSNFEEEEELDEKTLYQYKNEQDLIDNTIHINLLIQDYCYNMGLKICEKLTSNDIYNLINNYN